MREKGLNKITPLPATYIGPTLHELFTAARQRCSHCSLLNRLEIAVAAELRKRQASAVAQGRAAAEHGHPDLRGYTVEAGALAGQLAAFLSEKVK